MELIWRGRMKRVSIKGLDYFQSRGSVCVVKRK